MAVLVISAARAQQAPAADPVLGDAAFRPTAAHPVGWRGDGSGVFPGAGPHPMDWSLEEDRNVVWRTAMPGFSHATPIVVGDLVITLADPDVVVACSLHTGAVVWHTAVSELPDEVRAIAAELSLAQGTYRQKIGKEGPRGEKTELFAKLFSKEGKKWKDPYGLEMYQEWQQHVSRSMPTPVSDGEHIYVKLQVGVVACLDLGGKVRWRRTYRPWGKIDVVSPVLADGVLIVMGAEEEGEKDGATVGLHASTGKTVWRSDAIKRCSWGAGSPVVMRHPERTVVISSGGTVFDPRDGTIHFAAVGSHVDGGSPGIWDTVLAFGPTDGRGYRSRFNKEHADKSKDERRRLLELDREEKAKEMDIHHIDGNRFIQLHPSADGVAGEVLHHSLDRSYDCTFNSPLVHPSGCAYFCQGGDKNGTICVFDIASRRLVQEVKLDGVPGADGKCFNYCPPAATMHTFIYSIHGPQEPGGQNQTYIFSIGKDGTLKRQNTLKMDRHVAPPFFHGKQMLFRTATELICIGG